MKVHKERHFISVKKKLVCCCVFLLAVGIFSAALVFAGNRMQNRNWNEILEMQGIFSRYYADLANADHMMYQYILAPDAQKKQAYRDCIKAVQSFDESSLRLREHFDGYMAEDYYQMAQNYLSQVRMLLENEQEKDYETTLEAYTQAANVKKIIENAYISLWNMVDENVKIQKERLDTVWSRIWTAASASVLAVAFACIWYILRFSEKFLHPVLELTHTAEVMNEGQEEPERMLLSEMSRDEMQILAEVFYRLIDMTQAQMAELVKKQELEKQLKDEEIERITAQKQLHQARLQMFQSLVNPHFLFNILSVMADLSMREHAPQTQEAIEQLSLSLRYSLSYMNKTAALSQEASNLRYYFYLQRLRFGSRFQFRIEIDPDCEDAAMPAMILQPLAENAMQHGVGSYPAGGWIHCSARRECDQVCVIMEDNGIGMTEEELARLYERIQHGLTGDFSHGIGMILVYHRMKEFFQESCSLNIESEPGRGTKITIRFPDKREPAYKRQMTEEITYDSSGTGG